MDKSTESTEIILLTRQEYCHIIDNNTGIVRLVEGPYRGPLELNEEVFGSIREKIIVKEGQYATILNPYDAQAGDLRIGDREIRVGPTIFSLYPGEDIENGMINEIFVLVENSGLLLKALRDFNENGMPRKAGELWIIEGPIQFIPNKYASVVKTVKSISLGLNDGIYIKDVPTGVIRLESGAKTIMLSPQEELFEKVYTPREMEALELVEGKFDPTRSIPLNLLENEVVMIISGDALRVEVGPKVILLQPFERLYIMSISGSTPKRPNMLKLWKVFVGPVFTSDELSVRTKDNALLKILVRYKIRFAVDPEHLEKIFAVEDFVGFTTETMAALIRQEAAQYDFEEFHSNAAKIVKAIIFPPGKNSYTFAENGLEIFGIDIKKIVPEDPEIAAQLNSAIKSNMNVYVKKIQQSAELEAERQLVQGKTEIESAKQALIQLEQENYKAKEVGIAKIDAQAYIERAKGDTEAQRIKSEMENDIEMEKMKQSLAILQEKGADSYLRLAQVRAFANVEKTIIVPSDSRLFMPLGRLDLTDKIIDDAEA